MKIHLPQNVDYIINELIKHGYDAYAVGGCIRDSILGKEPEDWDITTSAKPLEIKQIFKRTIDTGIQHGTVTVMLDKEGYEVTTYRIDGEYEDNRHPKSVEFTTNLTEDLRRRDFTINAMAFNELEGLVDVFGGLDDLKDGIIRCVGSAVERFEEDALRILRAVRFSAQLGFCIEEGTIQAVKEKVQNLEHISAERIRVELNKLLLSPHPEKLLDAYSTGITKTILPEFNAMMERDSVGSLPKETVGQNTLKAIALVGNSHKTETVFGHLTEQKEYTKQEILILKWAMLLRRIAVPRDSSEIEVEEDFIFQDRASAATAKEILKRLKFDNDTVDTVYRLVLWNTYTIPITAAKLRRSIYQVGADIMELLLEVQKAGLMAENASDMECECKKLEQASELLYEIKSKKQCVCLKMLKINGKDLISIGFKPGVILGETLEKLLLKVIEEPSLNDRDILLKMASGYLE
ncbi:polynucleotide adenylyltransferase [Anaerocolumna cellulosilytica]|uniref:Polynucleotide adenylyltransferase n=1 Tax=Anaerocolumna cellulosilytica TaxID=433286 RepID=A0A6S6QPJ0_9FIRM|nr:CCA tRNA nucleotidyltransferase [Anaerocolumna cellulosilytica]MBB5196186.1 tRNA nucleotidyltransferase (CCA-adding enzyme) [Anaerocolumna cellulosilytica]BCJ92494.1 polynucleotide adenylyltransferase [Anaerocolumna cellulosilytica]